MPCTHEKVGTHKPEWLKIKLHNDPRYAAVAALVRRHDLHTICSSGRCPNISECWSRGTATFMIGGDVCTRACRFCATKSSASPAPLDAAEPERIARSVQLMGLRHAVITSVDRDDLPDGGAAHWAETVRAIRTLNPETTIELLIPDFSGDTGLLDVVLDAGADIVGHNLETTARLTPTVRDRRASYDTSLHVLRYVAARGAALGRDDLAKSALMVGLGETFDEVLGALDDLAEAGVRRMTIGQYLQPTPKHYPVAEYVHPDTFARYEAAAVERGIVYTESGPLVRSSYMADRLAPKMQRPLDTLTAREG
ncbi:lipoyl synthase [uncultured Rikenella sp.]|uniref:lipoyl synthase n=1 Tax=uncultured Rikenella sp. TaxID=368003 RepID=UPI0026000D3F|nr:lipoyl synthase [uncultured Rikenella sp.]